MQIAGEADHAFHLCTRLAEAGVEVRVLTTQGNIAINRPGLTTLPVIQQWSWKALPVVARQLWRIAPDAILLLYSGGPQYHYHPMITFLPTVAKAIRPQSPFVTQFENAYPPHWTTLVERIVRKGISPWVDAFGTLLAQSHRVIVLSEHQYSALAKHYPGVEKKSVLLPPPPIMEIAPESNGLTRERGRKLLGVKPGEFLLIYFGYIYQGKGVETLLQAFQTVANQGRAIRLALVGSEVALPARPHYGQEMRTLSKQLGIGDQVIWTGGYAWDSDEGSVYLRSADACVLPFDKGIQLNNSSFAAAAAHGLPIVTTQGTTLESPFIPSENVLLSHPQDPSALAAAITTLLDSPALCHRLGHGALQLAYEWFSWKKTVQRTITTLSAHE